MVLFLGHDDQEDLRNAGFSYMNNLKKTMIIAGGGFAGITALDTLHRLRKYWENDYELLLIDKKSTFDFLPLIPDVLAGWMAPAHIQVDLQHYCSSRHCRFIKGYIEDLDRENQIISTKKKKLAYQYAILACGGVPNFFGKTAAQENCFTLNSVADVLKIQQALIDGASDGKLVNIVVIGGGYTGIEAATSCMYFMQKRGHDCKICIVEKAGEILASIDGVVRKKAVNELQRLGIQLITGDSLEKVKGSRVFLESGRQIKNAVCIWSTGVKCPPFADEMALAKKRSRIVVDQFLNIPGDHKRTLFVVGDCAAFGREDVDQPLRMAVMFAIGQAKVAAKNIINDLCGRPFVAYKPRDLGYLVPLTYMKAPGIVLGKRTPARLGYILHYLISIFRAETSQKGGILRDFVFGRILQIKKNSNEKSRDQARRDMMNYKLDTLLLMLRLGIGIIFVAHGLQKLFGMFGGPGIDGFSEMVGNLGITNPVLWAWAVALGETFAGIFLLLGVFPRISAAVIAAVMISAVIKVHAQNGFFLADNGIEYTMLILINCFVLIISGAGQYAFFNRF
jgi:NADH:ubiquinone reductase (H+-translocating)